MNETCSCGGCQTNVDNLEGILRWVGVALHKIEELELTTDFNTLRDGTLFVRNALHNINFLLGGENNICECRREGN